MEKGFKDLRAAARRSTKHDVGLGGVLRVSGRDEGDSGICMDETESDVDRSGGTDDSLGRVNAGSPYQERRTSSRSNGRDPTIQFLVG